MRLLHDAKYVTSSVFIALVLSSLRSIVVLRLLGPVLIGAWKSAVLLDGFSEFARAGILKAMSIRIPVLDGQGNKERAEQVARTAGSFTVWLGAVLGLSIFAASFLAGTPEMRLSLRFVAVVVGLGQPYYYYREMAAARHNFVLRSKENVIRAVIEFVLAVALCKFFGLWGLGISCIAGLIAVTVYLERRQNLPMAWKPNGATMKGLMRVGVPFSLTEAGYELTRRMDVIMLAVVMGSAWVGYYGISLLIVDFALVLTRKGVSQVLSPHLLREYGRTGSHSEVAIFYEAPARLFCYVLPPALGAGAFFIGDFVNLVLPEYAPGIAAAQITVWCVFFMAIHASISSYFVASNMIPVIIRMFAGVIPVAALAQYVVIRSGYGLTGVAWCSLATMAVAAIAELYFARRSCGQSLSGIAGYLAGLHLPLAYAILLHAGVDALAITGVWVAPVKALLFLVLYTPLLLVYESRFAMLRTVRETM